MLLNKLLITFILLSFPFSVASKCGEVIVTQNRSDDIYEIFKEKRYYLYPLMFSQKNQSYNMPMILKEAAYREMKMQENMNIKVFTVDFCNDASILIETLLNIVLDQNVNFLEYSIRIHANFEHIKIAELILNYFEIGTRLFVNNFNAKTIYNQA